MMMRFKKITAAVCLYFLVATVVAAPPMVAAGAYLDPSNTQRPLLALSQDGGISWTFPQAITEPQPTPSFYGYGAFNSATCSGTICIAAGFYVDAQFIQKPLLAISQDSGATWIFPPSITEPLVDPVFNSNGVLNSASCYGKTCIAAGYYVDNRWMGRPLLAVSQDSGATWSFPALITQPPIVLAFSNSGVFYGTSCSSEATCIATGIYFDVNSLALPLLVVSKDAGATWSFPLSIVRPFTVPALVTGGFNRNIITPSSLTKSPLQFTREALNGQFNPWMGELIQSALFELESVEHCSADSSCPSTYFESRTGLNSFNP